MKIVFATYDRENDVSGVSSWLHRLLPRLKQSGLETEVHVSCQGARPGVNCARFAELQIPVRLIPSEVDTKQAVRNSLKLIEESQPDVYVPNCILPAYYAAGYARRQGVHTVGVLHSDDPFYWGIVDEFIKGSEAFRLSAVVAVSKFLTEAVEKALGAKKLPVRRIGCGVPIPGEIAQPAKGTFRLIYTGRLEEEQKCISEVTRSLCAVVKRNPGMEAWLVGEGSARPSVEKIIQESGVDPQRVKLVGRVEASTIYSILRTGHAFVLLSDYEGLPVSMMEAMAAGVVPVCLDMRSGIREVIQPGVNGLIVKNRQEDFYTAIESLQNDPSLWSRLSAQARATIQESFSEAAGAASWVDLISSFEKKPHTAPVKSAAFIRLPPQNAKFGIFDHRTSTLSRFRVALGHYRRKILNPSAHAL